jgi:hypothetical protein
MVYAGAQSLHICQINLNKKGSHEYCAREVRPAPCSVSSTPIGGYPIFNEGWQSDCSSDRERRP